MAQVRFTNYSTTTLAAGINATQTTMTVTDFTGWPTLGSGDWFYATLVDITSFNAGTVPPAVREIVKVTSYVGNLASIVRGQDSTLGHTFNAGDKCELRLNAAALNDVAGGGGGSGSVTSVGLAMPAEFVVSGSPVVNAGTLTATKATQAANTVWAGPASGGPAAPTFRAFVPSDIDPALTQTILTQAVESTLVNSRKLTAGTGITLTDGGPLGNLTIAATASGGGTLQSQPFTVSGTFNVPLNVTGVWLTMVGGGGGGCDTLNAAGDGGGGGGAGELVEEMLVPVTGGGTVTVTIGAAGAAGSGGVGGGNGGTTSFGSYAVLGGVGATGALGTSGAGGGPKGAAAVLNNNGGILGSAESPVSFGGSSGGGAGTAGAAGQAGGGASGLLLGGAGGASGSTKAGGGGGAATRWGVGGAGGAGEAAGNAPPAGSYGAGGGGGGANASTPRNGGAGLAGYCLVGWVA